MDFAKVAFLELLHSVLLKTFAIKKKKASSGVFVCEIMRQTVLCKILNIVYEWSVVRADK